MAPGYPLVVNGIPVKTSEALYQSLRYPHKPDVQKIILDQNSPMTAKMKSKKYYGDTRDDWKRIQFSIMKMCIEIKLIQNWENFSRVLLLTKDLPIVEEAPDGKIWGAALKDDHYIGTNALGRLLMQLREDFIINSIHPEVSIPNIDNLKLLGRKISYSSFNE
ncbi:MAG: NADAR family protein [Candidatus Marinimicrobia bacterium]|nr:NADAR family protein [Candidatus Neomarinimicrobiota bacterium]